MYQVMELSSGNDILDCPVLTVSHILWDKQTPPKTEARIGYVPEKGLRVHMITYEANPLRRYKNPQDPVYKDSAVECFISLDPAPTQQSVYCNFEINANGAMLAHWGTAGSGREPITPEEYEQTEVTATVRDSEWTVEFYIPEALLLRVFDRELAVGDVFSFNLYKIAEEAAIEHYASVFPVKSDVPNFHRPQDFGPAIVVV